MSDSDFTEEEKRHLINKGLVMEQLLQSDRFKNFFAVNYDLVREDNEMYVIEVPDEVAMQRAAKLAAQSAPAVAKPTSEELERFKK